MFDRDEFWQFIQPYARSAHEIVFRLKVTRGVAAGLEAGGAITTNCIDYEMACLQVLIATEKLAGAIAALHGLADRELVFAGDVPGWSLDPLAILPMPVDNEDGGFRLRRSDFVYPDEFRRLRDEAREALQPESLMSPEEAIPVDAVRSAADRLHHWLRSHLLIIPQFAGIAVIEHTADGLNCHLNSIDEIDWPWAGAPGAER